jgi:hypothetical protein
VIRRARQAILKFAELGVWSRVFHLTTLRSPTRDLRERAPAGIFARDRESSAPPYTSPVRKAPAHSRRRGAAACATQWPGTQ